MAKTRRSNKEALRNTSALPAPRKRSSYKTEEAYINAVYRYNKAYIDSHMDPELLKKSKSKGARAYFLDEVKRVRKLQNQMKDKHYTLRQALKRVSNSLILNPTMTASDIKSNNFESLLKKDKELYKEFRKRTRDEKKRFTKFDYSKVKFKGYFVVNGANAAVYSYDDDTYIVEKKSPPNGVGASYEIWSKDQFEVATGKTIFGPYTAKEMKS